MPRILCPSRLAAATVLAGILVAGAASPSSAAGGSSPVLPPANPMAGINLTVQPGSVCGNPAKNPGKSGGTYNHCTGGHHHTPPKKNH